MLQQFRERIKGWVALVIFSMLALTFLLWGVQYYLQSHNTPNKVVAKVNGHEIKSEDILRRFQQVQQHTRIAYSKQQRQAIQLQLLQRMIQQNVGIQAARNAGFMVTDDQVRAAIQSIPVFQQSGVYSPQRLQEYLTYSGQTMEQLYVRTRQGLLQLEVPRSISETSFVTQGDFNLAKSLVGRYAKFGYFVLPLKDYMKNTVPSEKAIKQYYAVNQSNYVVPESVQVQYLNLSPAEIKRSIHISDAAVKNYYDTHSQNYTKPAQWFVRRLLVPVQPGASKLKLSNMMRKLQHTSRDKGLVVLAKSNPDWKLVSNRYTQVQLQEAQLLPLFSSLKKGAISIPVRTEEGLNVFQVLSIKPAVSIPFEQVKNQIRLTLHRQAVSQRLNDASQQLSDLSYTNPSTLTVAARALHLSINTSPWFSKNQAVTGLFSNSSLRDLAFSDDVLSQGNNSKPVTLKDGSTLVLRIAKRRLQQVKPLTVVRAQVIKQLQLQNAKVTAGKVAGKVQATLKNGESAANVAKRFHLVWKTYALTSDMLPLVLNDVLLNHFGLPPVDLTNLKLPVDAPSFTVLQAAYSIDASKRPALGFTLLPKGDFVVIQLLPASHNLMDQLFVSQHEVILRDLMRFHQGLYYKLYLSGAQKRISVKVFPKKLNTP